MIDRVIDSVNTAAQRIGHRNKVTIVIVRVESRKKRVRTLAGNQLRCIDSICANMEEGYERKFGAEVKHFFRIAKGS